MRHIRGRPWCWPRRCWRWPPQRRRRRRRTNDPRRRYARMLVENGFKYGQMTKDQLEAVNATGGINGRKIEVILLDDECKPDKGIANVNRFIHQHQVHLIIGSTCSSVTLPIVRRHREQKVPQIVPHSTNASITQKGNEWIFRVSVSERFYAPCTPSTCPRTSARRSPISTRPTARRSRSQSSTWTTCGHLSGGAALCRADAGDGSRFPLAPSQDQIPRAGGARDRRPGGCDRPDCAAVLRGRHPGGCGSPHRPRPMRPCPSSRATPPWA